MQLTKNFTIEEFYASDTAKQKKINNTPPTSAVINITRLADNVMQNGFIFLSASMPTEKSV